MKKSSFNAKFREYAVSKISPTETERNFVSSVYGDVCDVLGENKCIQIGSYPRFTAIRPLHDLDVLYIIGQYDPRGVHPEGVLKELEQKINNEFKNSTSYEISISLQTHSITISFTSNGEEVFAIDIVPAYSSINKNEFGQDTYYVPEVLRVNHGKRNQFYAEKSIHHEDMGWIKSDPRGYIEVAKRVNNSNTDFRKTVKLIKFWKQNAKSIDENVKIKSFHIEQIITSYFSEDRSLDCFDAIFKFFSNLEQYVSSAQILDRADSSKYIDEYIDKLSEIQKNKILQARDYFMVKLEIFNDASSLDNLFTGGFYIRKSNEENFLFEQGIPILVDPVISFEIDGWVTTKGHKNGFQKYWLSKRDNKIKLEAGVQKNIKYIITKGKKLSGLTKWKVKNDNQSEQPRGEITDNNTRNNPESIAYKGNHYVDCFLIENNVCIARYRRYVAVI